MSSQPQIYVATHKETELPNHPGYIPLHVGKAISSQDLGFQGDDTGDNISTLNHSFCECTGIYWISKNVDAEYVGLVHYRRHFAALGHGIEFKGAQIASPDLFPEFERGANMIVAAPLGFLNGVSGTQISLEENYVGTAIGQDLVLVREAVEEHQPSYLSAYDFTMRSCQLNAYNMFVGKKSIVDEYADWLFPILFTLEKNIPYQFYETYQKRVFGFIAERLFTVWINKNRGRHKIVTREALFLP